MAKKKKETSFDDVLESAYWFLKTKLHFDDIQAVTTMLSIILLPITFYLGIINPNTTIRNTFYVTMALDVVVIIYSIAKFKYFKDLRAKEIKTAEKIKIKDMSIIDTLSGVDFEKFAIEYYKIQGYRTESTQFSHDSGADILADKNNIRLCIEAKRRKRKINRQVVLSVHYAMEHKYHADKAVIFTNSELTDQAKVTAKDKEVEYVDRYMIEKFIRKYPNIIINLK